MNSFTDHPGRRTLLMKAGGVIAVGMLLFAAGCYRHVVRESGPGSRDDVHEPNLKEGPIDRVLYGDK